MLFNQVKKHKKDILNTKTFLIIILDKIYNINALKIYSIVIYNRYL